MARPSFESLKPEYAALWMGITIRPERASEVRATARRVLDGRSRYEHVTAQTGVPWFVVGIIHQMECGLSFGQHLHNGDPLTARTRQVPAGRPKVGEPPFTWEESAVDAIRYDGLDKVPDWTVERIAYELECYNGLAYRKASINIHSPYLWSFTTVYERGKYIRDGVWSSVAVSQQSGAMAILKALVEIAPADVALGGGHEAHVEMMAAAWPAAEAVGGHEQPVSITKEAVRSKSNWWIGFGGIGAWVEEQFGFIKGMLPDAQQSVDDIVSPLTSLGGMLHANMTSVLAAVTLVTLVVVFIRHTRDKVELAKNTNA